MCSILDPARPRLMFEIFVTCSLAFLPHNEIPQSFNALRPYFSAKGVEFLEWFEVNYVSDTAMFKRINWSCYDMIQEDLFIAQSFAEAIHSSLNHLLNKKKPKFYQLLHYLDGVIKQVEHEFVEIESSSKIFKEDLRSTQRNKRLLEVLRNRALFGDKYFLMLALARAAGRKYQARFRSDGMIQQYITQSNLPSSPTIITTPENSTLAHNTPRLLRLALPRTPEEFRMSLSRTEAPVEEPRAVIQSIENIPTPASPIISIIPQETVDSNVTAHQQNQDEGFMNLTQQERNDVMIDMLVEDATERNQISSIMHDEIDTLAHSNELHMSRDEDSTVETSEPPKKRGRGRPKGSKNKPKCVQSNKNNSNFQMTKQNILKSASSGKTVAIMENLDPIGTQSVNILAHNRTNTTRGRKRKMM